MTLTDLAQLFDALFKSQITVGDQVYDPLVVQLLPILTLKSLNNLPVVTVLKLFRGVATSDELALSTKLKDACM